MADVAGAGGLTEPRRLEGPRARWPWARWWQLALLITGLAWLYHLMLQPSPLRTGLAWASGIALMLAATAGLARLLRFPVGWMRDAAASAERTGWSKTAARTLRSAVVFALGLLLWLLLGGHVAADLAGDPTLLQLAALLAAGGAACALAPLLVALGVVGWIADAPRQRKARRRRETADARVDDARGSIERLSPESLAVLLNDAFWRNNDIWLPQSYAPALLLVERDLAKVVQTYETVACFRVNGDVRRAVRAGRVRFRRPDGGVANAVHRTAYEAEKIARPLFGTVQLVLGPVAVDLSGAIGQGGGLPWRLASFTRFISRHGDKPMIVGRGTWTRLGAELGRRAETYVLASERGDDQSNDVHYVDSFDDALEAARVAAIARNVDQVVAVGGPRLIAEAMPRANRLSLLLVQAASVGEVRLEGYDEAAWNELRRGEHPKRAGNDHPFTYRFLRRRRGAKVVDGATSR